MTTVNTILHILFAHTQLERQGLNMHLDHGDAQLGQNFVENFFNARRRLFEGHQKLFFAFTFSVPSMVTSV